jgi:hypothetical protein
MAAIVESLLQLPITFKLVKGPADHFEREHLEIIRDRSFDLLSRPIFWHKQTLFKNGYEVYPIVEPT